jgi:hypothetical protein
MTTALSPAAVRDELVKALRLDTVGPNAGDAYAKEELPQAPSRWYLTGFLVPYEAPAEQREDEQGQEQLDLSGAAGATDDDEMPEPASARRAFFPSSVGLSVLAPASARTMTAIAEWGDYRYLEAEKKDEGGSGEGKREEGPPDHWVREQRRAEVVLTVGDTGKPLQTDVPGSDGLRLYTSAQPVAADLGGEDGLPKGTRSVSVFLVNHRKPAAAEVKDEAFVFQARLTLRLDTSFVPRPNLRGLLADEWDEQVADLQYRDAYEYAVGHGVAAEAQLAGGGECHEVATTWLPTAEVEKVEPSPIADVELGMEALAELPSAPAFRDKVGGLVLHYREWVDAQAARAPAKGRRGEVAKQLLLQARAASDRIERGLRALDDPLVLDAFRIANRTMATAARRRFAQIQGKDPAALDPPRWRPFQLAFILMNLDGLADPLHPDRALVDLLFFPTGGGKTEAYLGLAAFTLVLRRLRHPGLASAGVSVLMRYTLRLLTLDQLSRAAGLICALELERRKDPRLGTWPFEIGLWVGRGATPNRMGRLGDPDRQSARSRTIAFQNDDRRPSPIPLETCPWCGTKFNRNSFTLTPNSNQPTNLKVACVNRRCDFRGDNALPIVAVDEPIYRRLPCFLIATVDKFAGLPWVGRVGALFGKVDHFDDEGFYGPCDAGVGRRLEGPLPPPDLIVQDELHLISGPLGTMVGLYETAIDDLCSQAVGERRVRPKVVASTATVRRADSQVRALFARPQVEVFPPPGPDRRDSFFAHTVPSSEKNARLYVGLTAQGRSPKVVLLRAFLPLLAAAQRLYVAAGGDANTANPVDPYMTLVGYFNSLRELGGSRRIVEDEIGARLASYGRRLRAGETAGPFADRRIDYEVVELTSREPTNRVADAKRRLALLFREKERVDVALATNMISVGLDISRLGLMVVNGQPKTTAEYIQATSRVGREDERPGLVVTLLNLHRPRDRSHYERFAAYHASFYRAVEATSVTPFAPRAVDRGIAAITVGLARHGEPALTPPLQAEAITAQRPKLAFVADNVARRVEEHAKLNRAEADEMKARLRGRVNDLLDEWSKTADRQIHVSARLQYGHEETAPALLKDPLDPAFPALPPHERKFRAQRSLRDVEASVPLWVKRLDFTDLPTEEE